MAGTAKAPSARDLNALEESSCHPKILASEEAIYEIKWLESIDRLPQLFGALVYPFPIG
jgi:hypothetical protein